MASVMLIDGNSLAYRAFFALPQDIMTASGQVTNAVYGFTSMLLNLLREHDPDRLVVAFDRPEPTFRHERVETYKGNREKAPDILREQMGLVREMADAFHLPVVDLARFEADDIIATLATQAEAMGDDVWIVSGDRDCLQLVHDPHIQVLYTNTRGVSELKAFDEAGVQEKTGVLPNLYVQYAALRGDPSDNLPGVPGVGEKTAAKLINTYGGLDGIFEHVDDQTPKLRSNLVEHEIQARTNAEVMELIRDAPVDLDLATLEREPPDGEEIRRLFGLLEFRNDNLLERLDEVLDAAGSSGSRGGRGQVLEPVITEIGSAADAAKLLVSLHDAMPDSEAVLALAPAWAGAEGRSALSGLAVATLAGPLTAALDARGLRTLNDDIEVPLVRVLARMEVAGIRVDVDELRALNDQMEDECTALTKQIWDDAGEQFNINSTPQLREVLFDKLGLKPQKKTKTGYSTDAASLEKLLDQHPIIEHLLRYREVEKLRSTYGIGLLAEVGPDERIHATFNQTVARTGRLSSDAPNLHNIPVRTDQGRSFRKVFVPAEGYEFLVADYNQIELRCIAHLAEDPGLIAAFENGDDIHAATASRIFGVDPANVTTEQRSKSKMVSYGLAYGMEAFGLGQRLNIPTGEAQKILDAYFEGFPSVRDYMDRVVVEARDKGYTETLFGRRRQIAELSSSRWQVRQAGERQAKNAGIQGLAADIFKVALVNLDRALEAGGFSSRLILQVHDEVIVELLPAERDEVTAITLEAMTTAFDLRVPLEVHLAFGPSWADAKG